MKQLQKKLNLLLDKYDVSVAVNIQNTRGCVDIKGHF